MQYDLLTKEQKAAIREDVVAPVAPPISDDLRAAWQADHYAHSVCLNSGNCPHEPGYHEAAMRAIEKALGL